MRLVLTGGGTGGHIYPALTLLRYIESTSEPVDVLYIGSKNGLEHGIVEREGIAFQSIPAAGLRRQLSVKGLKTFWTTFRGYRRAKKLIRQFKPDVVVGTGGYVTLPVVFAASSLKVPSIVWEGNARPGLTNQLCARRSYGVAVCFEDSKRYLPKARRVVVTGNPRASEVLEVKTEQVSRAKETYHLLDGKKLILCFSGSRGAETIHDVFTDVIPKFAEQPDWQLIYVTGDKHYDSMMQRLGRIPDNVQVVAFIHDMPSLLPHVNAMVTRAGSSTLAELCAFGIPSILIPSPYVTANHQEENAKRLVNHRAALMIRERELTPTSLLDGLHKLLETPEGKELGSNARRLATPDAVQDLYQLVRDAIAESAR